MKVLPSKFFLLYFLVILVARSLVTRRCGKKIEKFDSNGETINASALFFCFPSLWSIEVKRGIAKTELNIRLNISSFN